MGELYIDHVWSKAWIIKMHVKRHLPIFEGKKHLHFTNAMTLEHFNSLDYLAQRRYIEKLMIDGKVLPDPYSVTEDWWTDNDTVARSAVWRLVFVFNWK